MTFGRSGDKEGACHSLSYFRTCVVHFVLRFFVVTVPESCDDGCRVFPWIIDVFEIPAYYFYKVIEVLIRAEEGLSRDIVKHLNHVSYLLALSLRWWCSTCVCGLPKVTFPVTGSPYFPGETTVVCSFSFQDV